MGYLEKADHDYEMYRDDGWMWDSSKQKPMSQHERLEVKQKTCGGFEYRLIEAWYVADSGNKARLEEAFKNTQFDLTK